MGDPVHCSASAATANAVHDSIPQRHLDAWGDLFRSNNDNRVINRDALELFHDAGFVHPEKYRLTCMGDVRRGGRKPDERCKAGLSSPGSYSNVKEYYELFYNDSYHGTELEGKIHERATHFLCATHVDQVQRVAGGLYRVVERRREAQRRTHGSPHSISIKQEAGVVQPDDTVMHDTSTTPDEPQHSQFPASEELWRLFQRLKGDHFAEPRVIGGDESVVGLINQMLESSIPYEHMPPSDQSKLVAAAQRAYSWINEQLSRVFNQVLGDRSAVRHVVDDDASIAGLFNDLIEHGKKYEDMSTLDQSKLWEAGKRAAWCLDVMAQRGQEHQFG